MGEGEHSSGDSVPASVNGTDSTNQPLPQRGRGAGGEGCPQRSAPPAWQRERTADGRTERWPPNTMVADARYEPHEKSEFLIMLSDRGI